MKVLIVRHAIAVPSGTPDIDDRDRPLTPRGRKRFRKAAQGLACILPRPDALFTSPLPRALETAGGIFYVDGASVLYLVGSTMDWREDDFAAGFVFDNPNAKGACGCGESFTV